MRRNVPEYLAQDRSDRSGAADIPLRHEPDEEEDKAEEDDRKEDDDDDDRRRLLGVSVPLLSG